MQPPSDDRAEQPATALDDVFRRESGRVVASLMGLLRDLDLAEEVLQETLLAAMERWPFSGVPENPGAWLTAAARNRALDHLRRQKRVRAKHREIAARLDGQTAPEAVPDDAPVADERLKLIFMCCHPSLAPESQVALTLRTVAGLTTPEIARAFLVSEPTIAQRIVRAKKTIGEQNVRFEEPASADLPGRLAAVLDVIYLVFNEAYTARQGPHHVRLDLCREALRLGSLLCELTPHEPEALGLLSLMELQASRNATRTDEHGKLILLPDQDRGRWEHALIGRALARLRAAASQGEAGRFHLQAEIAACHAMAASWQETDWRKIVSLYTALQEIFPSPIVELNRAVAVSMADGPAAGLALLDVLEKAPPLREYHLLPAARAEMLRRLERWPEARAEYGRAANLTANEYEREFLLRRARECDSHRR